MFAINGVATFMPLAFYRSFHSRPDKFAQFLAPRKEFPQFHWTRNTAGSVGSFERATPKVKFKGTDVRVLYVREIPTRFLVDAKFLRRLVARDGIEPPTPAFSGPPAESRKWFEINGSY
jgi:hypothetical protein